MILAARYIARLWNVPLGEEYASISASINSTVLLFSVVGLLLLFIPCYVGIRIGARFATLLGIVSMVPLTLLIILPFFKPSTIKWANVSGFHFAEDAGSFSSLVSWVFIMSCSVLALESAACYIGECREPARDAKIAMGALALYGFSIYGTLPLMLVLVLGRADTDPMTAFLAYTEAIFGGEGRAKWLIGIPLIVALLLSVFNAIMGCGRSLYQVAQDGLLPRIFCHTNRHGAPDYAMAFNLICSLRSFWKTALPVTGYPSWSAS
jgi:amino acid transporter